MVVVALLLSAGLIYFYRSKSPSYIPEGTVSKEIVLPPNSWYNNSWGRVIISGIPSQNAPWDWIMVLPVKFSFAEKQFAFGTVLVQGAYSPFQIELPARPKKVELDPDRWILAEGFSTKELK